MKKIFSLFILASLSSGCAHRIADLTVGSTKNINLNSDSLIVGKKVEGDDYMPVFLFPFGVPNIENAIDDAIEQDKCVVGLTNIKIEHVNQSFVVGRFGYRVEGQLLYDTAKKGCENTIITQ